MKSTIERIPVVAGTTMLVAMMLLAAGCASPGYKEGEKTARNIQKAADRIAAMPEEINLAMINLNDLVNNPAADLRPQYKKFVSGLEKAMKAADHLTAARRSMGEKGKEFFANWDKQLAEIQNEDIKTRSEARKDEVNKKLLAIKASYEKAEEAFKPFIADLQDVQRYLAADLNQGGLAAIRDTVAKASNDVGPVNDSLKALASDFRALGVAMSSVTPQPKK